MIIIKKEIILNIKTIITVTNQIVRHNRKISHLTF